MAEARRRWGARGGPTLALFSPNWGCAEIFDVRPATVVAARSI